MPSILISPQQENSADIILHSAIDPHSGSDDYVTELYRRGIARKIVCVSSQVSWQVYPGDYTREHLIALGVPAEDVLSWRLPMADCSAVTFATLVEYVKGQGWKSVLLVGQPEGSRYGSWLGRRAFEKQGIAFAMTYAPVDRDELITQWWRTHWKAQRLIQMVMNITIDLFYAECR